jgi:phage/plasmid-like protein (TIGR03299 family)
MAYVGETPWHGLGQQLTAGASIETWIKEAGMDYEVLEAPVRFTAGSTECIFPGRKALYRSDDQTPLGLVGDRYNIVQPREVVEFFRDLAEDHGFELETAGVLFNGKKYWALAKTPLELTVGKKDLVKAHMLMATSCDGSMSTVNKYVATRVVCNNTIQMALGESGAESKTRHNAKFKADDVKSEMALVGQAWDDFRVNAKALGSRKMNQQDIVSFLIKLYGDAEKPIEEQTANSDTMKRIATKFVTRDYIGADLSVDTAWGLVNCVTEFIDHDRGNSQDRRLEYAFFGGGADLKVQALKVALEFV